MASEPVRGLDSLNKAFGLADAQMRKYLPIVLSNLAEPVRRGSELRAGQIGAGPVWSQMRRGATRQSVYIAPVKTGTRDDRKRRPQFANRMLELAMLPALDANRTEIAKGVDQLVDRIASEFNRG